MTIPMATRGGVLGVVLTVLVLSVPAFGQGDLSPAAHPAPSMKTLTQIEPREDLTTAPTNRVSTSDPDFYYVINAPGSYYLPRNLAAGGLGIGSPAKPGVVKIAADDVTLDLNGFQLRGLSSTFPGSVVADTAIEIAGTNVRVFNGAIRGFRNGVAPFDSNAAEGSVVTDLRVADCETAINTAGHGAISRCTVVDTRARDTTTIIVIFGETVSQCTVRNGTLPDGGGLSGGIVGGNVTECVVEALSGNCRGIQGDVVIDCSVRNLSGEQVIGILVYEFARSCTVDGVSTNFDNTMTGISVQSSAVVEHCKVRAVENHTGFNLRYGSSASGCYAYGGRTGFLVDSAGRVTLRACTAVNNAVGFDVTEDFGDGDGSVLLDCVASDNTDGGAGRGFLVGRHRNRLIGCQADRNDHNFWISGNHNHLERCVAIATAVAGGTGFSVSGSNNTVIRCEAKNCSTNYALDASTRAGPIVADPATATNPFTNFSN